MNFNARQGTRRHIFVAAAYFLVVIAATLVIVRARSSGAFDLTPCERDDINCNKQDEEIAQLNKTATDFISQLEFSRQHYFATRRKLIEERERLRTQYGYYKETKKLAICFSGFLRNLSLTEDRIRNDLFGLFGEENIDIILYVPKVIVNGTEEPLPTVSWNVAELRTYKQEDLREPKAGHLYNYRTNFQGWLQQYYGIAGCYDMIREYQERTKIKYEWVARARTDAVYFYNATLKESLSLKTLDSNVWWIPDNQHWDGANDKFMLSSNVNYELYADFNNVYYYTGLFKPRSFTNRWLNFMASKLKALKILRRSLYVKMARMGCIKL